MEFSDELIESTYNCRRSELLELIKLNFSHYFDKKTENQYVGLLNQGATCYLNSILQTLNHDKKFISALFETLSDDSILTELRYLFAMMHLSDHATISTKRLTTAFGWSNSFSHEQSDIHEFLSVLIDALCNVSKDFNSKINQIYLGSISDLLRCPECDHARENNMNFYSLSINLPEDKLQKNENNHSILNLKDLLQSFEKTEILDADNLWECSGCNKRVQGQKSLKVTKWPVNLFLHINRIKFDPKTYKKIKMPFPVIFPDNLDTSVHSSIEKKYKLKAVLVHTGTATGGHYKTYIKKNKNYIECNDDVTHVLTPTEKEKMFWGGDFNSKSHSRSSEIDDSQFIKERNMSIYENVYMLLYVSSIDDEDDGDNYDDDDDDDDDDDEICRMIPNNLKDKITNENNYFKEMKILYDYHQEFVEVNLYQTFTSLMLESEESFGNVNKLFVVSIHQSKTLDELFLEACRIIYPNNEIKPKDSSILYSKYRLRKYHPSLKRATKTYKGKENMTLKDLGIQHKTCFCLEMKSEYESFEEYDENSMSFNLRLWLNDVDVDNSSMKRSYEYILENNVQFISKVLCQVQVPFPLPSSEQLEQSEHDPKPKPEPGSTHQSSYFPQEERYISNPIHLTPEFLLVVKNKILQSLLNVLNQYPELKSYLGSDLNNFHEDHNYIITLDKLAVIYTDANIVNDKIDYTTVNNVYELTDNYDKIMKCSHFNLTEEELIVEIFPPGNTFPNGVFNKTVGAAAVEQEEDKVKSKCEYGNLKCSNVAKSHAFQVLHTMKSLLKVFFNIPFSKDEKSIFPEPPPADYIIISSDCSLLNLKEKILNYFNEKKGKLIALGYVITNIESLTLDDFYICHNDASQPFKDQAKSLSELHINSQTNLFIKFGKVSKPGEYNILLELDNETKGTTASRLINVGSIIVDQSWKVCDLKGKIFETWSQRINNLLDSKRDLLNPEKHIIESAMCIRLRDDSTSLFPVLKDEKIISRALFGLVDEKKIIVQVLKVPETIKNNLVIYCRFVSYRNKSITSPLDGLVTIQRDYSIEDLKKAIMTCHPKLKTNSVATQTQTQTQTQEGISIAKGYTSGPPLSFKAVSQLKWIDITLGEDEEKEEIIQEGSSSNMSNFLGLRDGSVILVKFQKDEYKVENQSSVKQSSKFGKSKLTSFKKNVNLTAEKPIVIHSKSLEEKKESVVFETTFSSLNSTEPNFLRDKSYAYRKDDDCVSDLKINNSTVTVTSPKPQDFDPPKLLSPTTTSTVTVTVDNNSSKVTVNVPPVYLPDSVLLLGFPPQPKSDSN